MDFDHYGNLLVEVNGFPAVKPSPWLFSDGMGFADEAVWWSSAWGKRPVPHEGLDLVQFTLGAGVQGVFSGFLIVAPVSGVVVDICDDFLAETVWLNPDGQPQHLVLLSHIEPWVVPGQRLVCGDPVGVVCFPVNNVPLHLHLSLLEGQWQRMKALTWDEVHGQSHARFVYPSF